MSQPSNQIFDDFDVFQSIFQPDQQQKPNIKEEQVQNAQLKPKTNLFALTDQFKSNLNKKLPKGFILLRKSQIPFSPDPFEGSIQYVHVERAPKIASLELLQKFPIPVLSQQFKAKKQQKANDKPVGLRLGGLGLPQGKSKQTQKVKGILQRFRKHPKYAILAQHLNKLGFLQGFAQIESQFKKNIHTIDSFKDRCLYILNHAKKITFAEATIQVINELIDEFMFQVQQARKIQFQTNLQNIQKNVDKITREITDIKQSGNWYVRKKKRSDKNYDQKQIMYIADLARQLPQAYLVGVWQIIEQKPFFQSNQKQLHIDFSNIKTKKIRQLQFYIKRKLSAYYRSRQRKRQKIQRKRVEQLNKLNQQNQLVKEEEDQRKSLDYKDYKDSKSQKLQGEQEQEDNQQKEYKQDMLDSQLLFGKILKKNNSKVQKNIDFMIDQSQIEEKKQSQKKFPDEDDFLKELIENQNLIRQDYEQIRSNEDNINGNQLMKAQENELQMVQVNFNLPLDAQGDSSDSSMITDDEDSQF